MFVLMFSVFQNVSLIKTVENLFLSIIAFKRLVMTAVLFVIFHQAFISLTNNNY